MPDFLTAQQFSDWEFCPRLPQLGRTIEPGSWPIRIALRRYLHAAVRQLSTGDAACDVAFDQCQAFLEEGADRGFEHIIPLQAHDRNAYILIRDYACWLEAAIYLVDEFLPGRLAASDPVYLGDTPVHVDCWRERGSMECGHAFRITDRPDTDGHVRWNELLASLDPTLQEIVIHTFILPAPVKDRLASPLVLAYQDITGHLRLASRRTESMVFNNKWTRVARWETEGRGRDTIRWPEWREGITRDECLARCYEEYTVPRIQVAGLLDDAKVIAREILRDDSPKKQEVCRRCYMRGWCHGDEESRQGYRITSVRAPASTDPASLAAARK